MTILHRRSVIVGAAAATLGAPAIARAQADWPKGPIKFVVPFPPGGSTDPITRIIQAKMIENTGWNIVVDNKPGGTGVVGASIVAKSPPDGQTWLFVFDNHILNPIWTASVP
jgi:tripartite-type tricarboxylate transporter receptor subunit TctC